MPKVMLPLSYQPLWMPTEALAAGPWEPVCAPVRLAAAASSVSFQNIPAAFVMFRLVCQIIKDGTLGLISFTLNNDTGANYSRQYLSAASTTVSAGRDSAQTSANLLVGPEANAHSTFDAVIAKPLASTAGLISVMNVSFQTNIRLVDHAFIWANTAALINRIDVLSSVTDFAADSILILEGSRF